MAIVITSADYVEYIKVAAAKIAASGDYISGLDAATGDGDHWANINMGFESLVAAANELAALPIDKCFFKIGNLMMSTIGGSSGILYGGAYMAAAKAIKGKAEIDLEGLSISLEAMVNDMMNRGKAEPGMKTMIDTLYPAAQTLKAAIAAGKEESIALKELKQAAMDGADSTRDMQAVKGRASYQTNRGVGHLDPGAVTMSYQLECLCDYLTGKIA